MGAPAHRRRIVVLACAVVSVGCTLPDAPGLRYDAAALLDRVVLDVPSSPEVGIDVSVTDVTSERPAGDAAACTAPMVSCGSGCVDTRGDIANCGACGRVCPAATNAQPTCAGGACGFACVAGTGDCDGDASNGCETNFATRLVHCGRCGNACLAGQTCVSGACQTAAGTLVQRSCAMMGTAGCGMVAISGGTFTMGEASMANNASPVQPNTTVGNFAIDAYEVTVVRFRAFVAAGRPAPSGPVMYRGGAMAFVGTVSTDRELSCDSYANYPRSDREFHPMNCVNWATAQAFCVWDGGRLPTQAEWEFAARGSTGRPYPWGTETPDNARSCWSGSGMSRTSTCLVGSVTLGASPNGVHDLAGNVWEWNADWYVAYASIGTGCWNGSGSTNAICNDRAIVSRLVRGGSWFDADSSFLRSASRLGDSPASHTGDVGFRCARDTP